MPQWGFGMPPPGFMDLIQQKYAIQQQEATARANALNASALVDTTKAGLMPAESAANVGETKARTSNINVNTRFAPFTLGSSALQNLGQATDAFSQAAKTDVEAKGLRDLNTTLSPTSLGLLGD